MAIAAAVVGVVAGGIKASAARKGRMAGEARTRAADKYNREIYGGTKDRFSPYIEQGRYGIKGMRSLLEDPSSVKNLLGYQFRLGEGQRRIEQGAAAKGGLFSGSLMEELTRYGQEFASGEYENEFSRRMKLAGMGMEANRVVANAGLGSASNTSKLFMEQNTLGAQYRKQQAAGQAQIVSSIGRGVSYFGGTQSIKDFDTGMGK